MELPILSLLQALSSSFFRHKHMHIDMYSCMHVHMHKDYFHTGSRHCFKNLSCFLCLSLIHSQVLILENGAYGKRMSLICEATSIPYHMESFPENESVNLARVSELLKGDTYSLVSCVHCETSSGVFNPVEQVGQLVKAANPGDYSSHHFKH